MPYGFRNSESQNRESGNAEKRQIMVRSDAFRWPPPVNIGPNAVHRFLHGAVFSLLTMRIMVR